MSIYRLVNIVQPYSWGSTTAIPRLLGRANPREQAQAELWMGAHPLGCSQVELPDGSLQALDHFLSTHPQQLGLARRFGRLPYLFKVLAAAQPLSLQVHPSKEQAKAGWAKEEAQGLPLNDPRRNYKDDNHKPEILLALGDFSAMAGLRPLDQIRKNLSPLLPQLDYSSHRRFFEGLMHLPSRESADALQRLPQPLPASPAYRWVERMMVLYPADITALAPLYLNLIELRDGQAIYLPARVLHAYLEGVGIELMANSDNVLRGGLTPKYCDIPELLNVLDFAEHRPTVLGPQALDSWRQCYPTPTEEFSLQQWTLAGKARLECQQSPTIALVLDGETTLECDHRTLNLKKGESVFIGAAQNGLTLTGNAQLTAAVVPQTKP